jgi:hypothetical protein
MGGVADRVHLYLEPAKIKKSQMNVQEEGIDDEMPEEGEMSNENEVNKVSWKRILDLLTLKKGLEIVVGTSPLAYTMVTLWPI